jgi:hypothetical protein
MFEIMQFKNIFKIQTADLLLKKVFALLEKYTYICKHDFM